jgi:hypothetical protein
MAKLFYSLPEAATKLKLSEDQVKNLVTSGKLQEFRDRDRLMFKVEQVDLMAGGGEEDTGHGIPLAESGEADAISLAESGTGMGLETPKEQTGISIFETENTDQDDPSAVTQVTETSPTELSLETVGSGSGLMDLTREGDDTSLGADLLEDIYSGGSGTAPAQSAVGAGAAPAEGGALFESTTATETETAVAMTPAMMAAMSEPYDGAASGWIGGAALGMVLTLLLCLALVLSGLTGTGGFKLVDMIGGQQWWMWPAIMAGVTAVAALIGWALGKRT